MSTREIAELTGKRHDHVLRDARNLLAELQSPKVGEITKTGRGEPTRCSCWIRANRSAWWLVIALSTGWPSSPDGKSWSSQPDRKAS
ncbi:Rha family transcriptional regulator [Edwardsiella tarda]